MCISAKQLVSALAKSGGSEHALEYYKDLRHWPDVAGIAMSGINIFVGDIIIVSALSTFSLVILSNLTPKVDLQGLAGLGSKLGRYDAPDSDHVRNGW